MAEDIKGLIEKIQRDGVNAAEEKARQIEAEATRRAKEIISKAKGEAEKILAEAQDLAVRKQESTKVSLQQAARDTLLSLKKEINAMLDRLITLRLQEALTPEEIAKIINLLIKDYGREDKGEVVISLSKQDYEKMERGFLGGLKDAAKKGIVLRPSQDISGGLIISYDAGKSHFDFTDKMLAGYISSSIKPKLAEILDTD